MITREDLARAIQGKDEEIARLRAEVSALRYTLKCIAVKAIAPHPTASRRWEIAEMATEGSKRARSGRATEDTPDE